MKNNQKRYRCGSAKFSENSSCRRRGDAKPVSDRAAKRPRVPGGSPRPLGDCRSGVQASKM